MRIEINIEKRHLYIFVAVILVLSLINFAVASTFVNPTTKVGHDASEIGSGTFGGVGTDLYTFPGSVALGISSPSEGPRLIWTGGNLEYRARVYSDGHLSFFPVELGNPGFIGEVLSLTQSGNVGVGTPSPLRRFNVDTSTSAYGLGDGILISGVNKYPTLAMVDGISGATIGLSSSNIGKLSSDENTGDLVLQSGSRILFNTNYGKGASTMAISGSSVSVAGTIKSSTRGDFYSVSVANDLTPQHNSCTDSSAILPDGSFSAWCQSACNRWCHYVKGYSSGTIVEYGNGGAGCACIP